MLARDRTLCWTCLVVFPFHPLHCCKLGHTSSSMNTLPHILCFVHVLVASSCCASHASSCYILLHHMSQPGLPNQLTLINR